MQDFEEVITNVLIAAKEDVLRTVETYGKRNLPPAEMGKASLRKYCL